MTDSEVLDRAVAILRKMSSKPDSFSLGVLCGILTDTAKVIRDKRADTPAS